MDDDGRVRLFEPENLEQNEIHHFAREQLAINI